MIVFGVCDILDLLIKMFRLTTQQFTKLFSSLLCVHFDAETCASEPQLRHKLPLNTRTLNGVWQRGATAGGCRNEKGLFISHIFRIYLFCQQTHFT
jgi:hypothetical protein